MLGAEIAILDPIFHQIYYWVMLKKNALQCFGVSFFKQKTHQPQRVENEPIDPLYMEL